VGRKVGRMVGRKEGRKEGRKVGRKELLTFEPHSDLQHRQVHSTLDSHQTNELYL
jgi:hypothetical protein